MKESPYLEGRDELLPRMLELPTLGGFQEKHLRQILNLSKIRQYDAGEVVIKQGELDCWVYILIQGAVKVERNGELLGRFQRGGDIFGEMGVINSEPRSARVVCEKRTTCLALDASVFDRLGGEDQLAFTALFYRLFSEVLSQRLRDTSQELVKVRAELEVLKVKTGVDFRE